MTTANSTATKPLIIERTFNAPAAQVWKAWSDPETFKRWWGPTGFSCPEANIDFRVGGKNHSSMRAPDGNEIWSVGTYKEIVPNKRIVVTDNFADAQGNVVPASHYGMPGEWVDEGLVTIDFSEENGKTKMTLKHEGLPTEILDDCRTGWSQSFDKLDAALKNNLERKQFKVSIDAPREKVWKILWDDATYREWTSAFNPGSYAESDWKKGSKILFLDGEGSGMTSVIADLVPNEFMSFKHLGEIHNGVEDFDSPQVQAWAGALENYTLTPANGKTDLTVEMDIDTSSSFADYLTTTFPKALAKVKEIAERK